MDPTEHPDDTTGGPARDATGDATGDAAGDAATDRHVDASGGALDGSADDSRPVRAEEAMPAVYEQLRRIAGSYFKAGGSATLQPTALVHEAWLKLGSSAAFRDEGHFMAVAATAMRQILVDRARRRMAVRHGGGRQREPLHADAAVMPAPDEDAVDVLSLDEALRTLADADPRRASVVELRFFAGASIEQTALALGCARSTVAEDWRVARAWLAAALGDADAEGDDGTGGSAASGPER